MLHNSDSSLRSDFCARSGVKFCYVAVRKVCLIHGKTSPSRCSVLSYLRTLTEASRNFKEKR